MSTCSVEGCENRGEVKGLCRKHYASKWQKERRLRPDGGTKRFHPLYHLWHERKQDGELCAEWLDFWVFIGSIGERPGKDFFLLRRDTSKPYGPQNFEWVPHLRRQPGETKKVWYARKWAHRRDANPGWGRDRDLVRKYGITRAEYEELLAAQDGRCAICRKEETAFDGKMGTVRRLAVDHCHTRKAVRGLLCFRCNSTIGRLGEDLELVDRIRDYLRRDAGEVQQGRQDRNPQDGQEDRRQRP